VTASSLFDAVGRIEGKRSGVAPLIRPDKGQRVAGIRILVVEDNAINQNVAQKILENEGAAVEIAGNGAEALARLREHGAEIDAVLMDAQMPVMDGFEATRRIRENLDLAELPIIALTAGVRSSERDLCLDSGMNDFVSEPLDVNKLIATILRHTSARKETALARNWPVQPAFSQSPLAGIPGLDLRQALQRLGGDEAMLWRLLRQLANDTVAPDLRCLIAQGHRREAAARLHTLIGGTGNLELALLAQQSTAAEAAILDGDMNRLSAHLDGLERHMLDFQRAVHELPPADEAKNGPSAQLEQAQLDRLESLLRTVIWKRSNSTNRSLQPLGRCWEKRGLTH
jgi:two-component system, sensor histidine kinase and response regulator